MQEQNALIYEISIKKQWDFADVFPYGVMGNQQGLIGGNQYARKRWENNISIHSNLTNEHRCLKTVGSFKSKLKTYMFKLAFNC